MSFEQSAERVKHVAKRAVAHDEAGEHQAAYASYMDACELLGGMMKQVPAPLFCCQCACSSWISTYTHLYKPSMP